MSLDDNKRLAREAGELWDGGDGTAIDRLFAADYVNHQNRADGASDIAGREAWRSFVATFAAAFPDFSYRVDMQIAEGDRVATSFSGAGTHQGSLFGLAPTGRRIAWTGISIDRIADGRIAETWINWDELGVMEQLGAVSRPD